MLARLPAPPPPPAPPPCIAPQAPINPSDLNTVQGKYPITPPLPGTPGHEGVGVVETVGSQVSSSADSPPEVWACLPASTQA